MSPLANRRFLKMNGLGNEIVVLDLRGAGLTRVGAAEARAIAADPRSAFDQLMVVHDPRSPGTDAYLCIYNADGSESGACGNGTRCVAWAMMRDPATGRPGDALLLESKAGLLPVSRVAERTFTVDMGDPHAVFWVDDVAAYDLAKIGPLLENHPIFPERANISLAQVTAPDRI